ncbi:MAG: NADH:flavin oxidoreductase [Deltaproteobacteria bacterium]|nr:NADH:flavin oxidoreductase [Deltaproteobacteria bacterium]
MDTKDRRFLDRLASKNISRRDFIRYSSATLAVASVPKLTGCATYQPRQDCQDQLINGLDRYHENVFEESKIGSIRLNNRVIRSATTLGLGDPNGNPTKELGDAYAELAMGGVGAIITGFSIVQKNGVPGIPNALLIDQDDQVRAYRKMSEAAHLHNTPIIMQIGHAGRQTRRAITGEKPVAPSPVPDKVYDEETPRALTDLEINDIIQNFIKAIERARDSGYDGVQLHVAHGYLLSAFLSSDTNRREDQWGGSLENRFRIVREIYEGARKRVGDYPILVKVNGYDFQSNGMRVEEMAQIATMLENVGCDAIEVSSGIANDGFATSRVPEIPTEAILEFHFKYKDSPYIVKKLLPVFAPLLVDRPEPIYNYNVCAAETIKQHVGIPVIVVGGIRNLHDIEQIIGRNMADYVSMGRPFIIEPDIVSKFKEESQKSSECISCAFCLLALAEGPTRCFYGEIS